MSRALLAWSLLWVLGASVVLSATDPVVSGQVVDREGRPVPGAKVSANAWWRPAVLRPDAAIDDRPWVTQSGPDGRFLFASEGALRRVLDADMVRVAASHGELVSRGYVLRAKDGHLEVPTLMLDYPVEVSLTLRWPDGSPVRDADVRLTMEDKRYLESDPRGAFFLAEGRSDSAGNWRIKGAPSGDYANIGAEVSVDGTVSTFASLGRQPTSTGRQIVLALTIDPAVRIEGSAFEADDRPATGIIVTDRDLESGDPDRRRYGMIDSTGRFTLDRTMPKSRWLVFCTPPSALLDDSVVGQPQPVHVIPLPLNRPATFRIGSVRLPARRDVRVHVTDEAGRPMTGHLILQRLEFAHGSTAYRLDGSGYASIRDVPVDVAHALNFTGTHPTHGDVQSRFYLPAGEYPSAEFRADGAGMLIVRFHEPRREESCRVWDPTISWRSGTGNLGASRRGLRSEIRLFVGGGRSGVVELRGNGVRAVIASNVRLKLDRPTILDVVVTPE